MATLNTLQKCKVPVWAWRFKQSTGRLLYVLRVLQHTQKPDVADFVLRCLHIELHELSFESGATCSSGNVYFMPRTDGSCSIARSRRIAMYGDDEFITFRDMRNAGIHKELPLHSHLFAAFNTYACNFHMMDSFLSWKPITQTNAKSELFASKVDHPYFTVLHGAQSVRSNQCHRQIWMKSDNQTPDDRPSRAELIVLISWMLGAMALQKPNTRRSTRKRHSVMHHVFPTMVISFQPRARARVLYGYFDGTLKVHFTKMQEFDVPKYTQKMDLLLRWAWPVLAGRTSTIIPLPTISESDEESLPGPEPMKRVSSKKFSLKEKMFSIAAGMSWPGKRPAFANKINHVCELRVRMASSKYA